MNLMCLRLRRTASRTAEVPRTGWVKDNYTAAVRGVNARARMERIRTFDLQRQGDCRQQGGEELRDAHAAAGTVLEDSEQVRNS